MLSKDLPAIIGRYEVVQELGRGGMGVVLLGRDPRIGRQVAIKLLDTREEGVAERFLQEARSAGQLRHRNIITIHDCGEINDGSERDGLPFIIMEFIEGTTLAGLIHSNDPSLSMSRKLGLIEDLEAHQIARRQTVIGGGLCGASGRGGGWCFARGERMCCNHVQQDEQQDAETLCDEGHTTGVIRRHGVWSKLIRRCVVTVQRSNAHLSVSHHCNLH